MYKSHKKNNYTNCQSVKKTKRSSKAKGLTTQSDKKIVLLNFKSGA